MASSPLLIIIILVLVSLLSYSTSFITELVHRDSVSSPMYNSSESTADRTRRLVRISYARLASIDDGMDSITVPLSKGEIFSGIYYVYFFVHNSSIMQSAVIDTGGITTWIMCYPCNKCHKTIFPLFDRTSSPTYKALNCSDPNCQIEITGRYFCYHSESQPLCMYNTNYLDGVDSTGYLSTDNFFFEDRIQSRTVIMESVVFGCSIQLRYGNIDVQAVDPLHMGVIGLGQDSSFAKRIGYFSYCLAPINKVDVSSEFATGFDARLEGGVTKFENSRGRYAASLEEIRIGSTTITFPPIKALIDSGAHLTFLPPNIFKKVVQVMDPLIQETNPRVDFDTDPDYCYDGRLRVLTRRLPIMTVHFSGNAKLVIHTQALFTLRGGGGAAYYCLGIRSTTSAPHGGSSLDGIALIGANFQINNNMGFDVHGQNIYMSSRLCNVSLDD